jgi:hypothetical protein
MNAVASAEPQSRREKADLGQRTLSQTPEELRAGLVADREEEEDEEGPLEGRRDLDPELAQGDAREEGRDHAIELDRADLEPGEQLAEREGQKERDFRMLAEGLNQPGHGGLPSCVRG